MPLNQLITNDQAIQTFCILDHPEIVELLKLTTGVNLMRRNSSKPITKICTFGSGKKLLLLDKMGKFDTIARSITKQF